MTKPDLILIWPKGYDYPLFRKTLYKNRTFFNKVIVCFTPQGDADLIPFLKDNLMDAELILMGMDYAGDWRDAAIKKCLERSTSDSILFMEQDFLIFSDNFFTRFESVIDNETYDYVYYDEGGRQHPAFMYVKRDLLNATSLDFAARPPSHDHFGQVTAELTVSAGVRMASLNEIGLLDQVDYFHMQSVTYNYEVVLTKKLQVDPMGIHNLFEFKYFRKYNQSSMECDVPQSPTWMAIMEFVEGEFDKCWDLAVSHSPKFKFLPI